MSEVLPIGDFTFLAADEVTSFDLNATTKFDDYGYIIEVDLKYPEHLHDSHLHYPLAAEKIKDSEPNVISLLIVPDQQTRDF